MNGIKERIKDAELAIFKAFYAVEDAVDASALWMALSRSLEDSARIRITELGGDVDRARQDLDKYALMNPSL